MATPNITREIFDGNLTRVTPIGVTNRRVVILGTASDGPMYAPVQVTSAGNAEDTFGSISDGTLVRGIKETLDAQAGFPKNPAVWGMRIGGIVASRSTKTVYDAATNGNVLLELEAIHEGTIYNDIYLNVDTTLNEVSVWNPKLKVFTKFKYNWNNANDANADVHSLQELVDAINGDRNLSSIVFAATPSLETSAEAFVLADNANFVTENAIGKTVVNLGGAIGGTAGTDGAVVLGAQQANGNGTNTSVIEEVEGNRFRDVLSAYSIYVSDWEKCLQNTPQHVVEDRFILNNVLVENSVRSILDVTTDSSSVTGCSSKSMGFYDFKEVTAQVSINAGGYVDDGLSESAITSMTLKFESGDDTVTGKWSGTETSEYDNPYEEDGSNNFQDFKIECQIDGGGWVELISTATLAANFGANDGSVVLTLDTTSTLDGTVIFNGATGILEGDSTVTNQAKVISFRISWTSNGFDLSESSNLSTLATPKDFFVQGNNVYFGGTGPMWPMYIRFAEVKYYSAADVGITLDGTDQHGILTIYDVFHRDKSAAPVYSTDDAIFGINMRYYGDVEQSGNGFGLPGNNYLAGGTNGTDMTNAQMYEDLDEAYDHFTSDFFDIFTVMGATFDANKTSTNDIGQTVTGNAYFASQMSDFIDAFNGEIIGIMGFEPIIGSGVGGRILKSDVDARVADVSGYVESMHQPFMFANDIEGIFSAAGTRYGAGSSPALAGLIAAIPINEALYRFSVPGMLGMVWRYSEVDKLSGMKQIDLMADARICVGQVSGEGIQMTEAKTLAVAGSDFENLMTVLILQQSLDICRVVARNYIGKVSSQALLQAFQSELNMAIGDTLVPGALRGFSAPIQMTPGERVVGKLTIPLTLSPQFEIRDVHYTVTLTADDIV